jgi:hypothetical protein
LITPQDVGPSLGHKNLNSSTEKCQELAGDRFLSRVAQELRLGRFFMHTRRPKKIEEFWLAGFYIAYFSHKLNAVFAPPAPGSRRNIYTYCLYLVPHSLCHNAIDNAAAGVANPARVNYIDNAIAAAGDANARGVSNANSRGVCVCNLRRPGDAHHPVG